MDDFVILFYAIDFFQIKFLDPTFREWINSNLQVFSENIASLLIEIYMNKMIFFSSRTWQNFLSLKMHQCSAVQCR